MKWVKHNERYARLMYLQHSVGVGVMEGDASLKSMGSSLLLCSCHCLMLLLAMQLNRDSLVFTKHSQNVVSQSSSIRQRD